MLVETSASEMSCEQGEGTNSGTNFPQHQQLFKEPEKLPVNVTSVFFRSVDIVSTAIA